MTYSVSNEEIERIAKELGIGVTFNSPTPGVRNSSTGEIKDFDTYFDNFFQSNDIGEVVKVTQLENVKLKMKKPKKNEKKLDGFLVFPDSPYVLAG